MKIERTHGLVLASDVYARHNIPFFMQSSVDGFALRFVDRLLGMHLAGEMAAGAVQPRRQEYGMGRCTDDIRLFETTR